MGRCVTPIGPSQAQKNAQNTQDATTNQAIANSSAANAQGMTSLGTGASNINSGTNFMNTLLNGNSANTSALLAPTINQNRSTNQQTLQALSTLTPRGGGRSGTLFDASFQPSVATQNFFNSGRTQAAQALPQIGLAQQGIGTNLLNTGNSALNTGLTGTQNQIQNQFQNTQYSNNLIGGLASSLFGLATAPITGFNGGSLGGAGLTALGLCWIAEALYGVNDLRTHIIRAWLRGPFGKTVKGRAAVLAYRTVGRAVAFFVKRSLTVRGIVRPLFEIGLSAATRQSTFVEIG